MSAIAARFAHELAGPWAAAGQAQELIEQKLDGLLTPTEQSFLRAGLGAKLLPAKLPTLPAQRLGDALTRKLQVAIGKNSAVRKLSAGLSAKQLERCLKIFDIGFAAKCSRLALFSGQQIIRNLRSLGDYARADLTQKVSLEETLHIGWMLCAGKNLSLRWRCARLPSITANPHALIQVWANLFSNIASVNPGGSQVTIEGKKQARLLTLSVANTGAPLPKGLKLFTPGASARAGGRGIGLNLCQQIIRAHGGQIKAANQPDLSGVVFTITLPVR